MPSGQQTVGTRTKDRSLNMERAPFVHLYFLSQLFSRDQSIRRLSSEVISPWSARFHTCPPCHAGCTVETNPAARANSYIGVTARQTSEIYCGSPRTTSTTSRAGGQSGLLVTSSVRKVPIQNMYVVVTCNFHLFVHCGW